MIYIVTLLMLSIACNIFCYFNHKQTVFLHEQALYDLKKSNQKELIAPAELTSFIHDVMSGKLGMIGITRIDQENLLYRSPRDRSS